MVVERMGLVCSPHNWLLSEWNLCRPIITRTRPGWFYSPEYFRDLDCIRQVLLTTFRSFVEEDALSFFCSGWIVQFAFFLRKCLVCFGMQPGLSCGWCAVSQTSGPEPALCFVCQIRWVVGSSRLAFGINMKVIFVSLCRQSLWANCFETWESGWPEEKRTARTGKGLLVWGALRNMANISGAGGASCSLFGMCVVMIWRCW